MPKPLRTSWPIPCWWTSRTAVRYWSLKNDVRKRVLAGLHARTELARALDQAPERPDNLLQQVLESWIKGEPKALDQQSPAELSATLQVIDWLETTELETSLPATDDVRRRVEYAALLQPFRDLVGTHFRGRARELSVLRDYLADSGAPGGNLRPLFIHGPGGMGKSTLLSKFILDTAATASIAIVYLDCDRPGLVAEEPLTLLAEAVRQLGLQFEHLRGSSLRLRTTWLAELANFHVAASDGLESKPLESVATRDRQNYVQTFALFARELPPSVPVLLAIDTFEELQFRSRDFVTELFKFLNELRTALPQLRIVISGRDELQPFETERLPLAELDAEAAEGYLAAEASIVPTCAASSRVRCEAIRSACHSQRRWSRAASCPPPKSASSNASLMTRRSRALSTAASSTTCTTPTPSWRELLIPASSCAESPRP